MKFGYARVSKNVQNLDIQLQKLQQAGCEEIWNPSSLLPCFCNLAQEYLSLSMYC
jgi:hypothetical protein